jgi:hypothetical protein
MPATLGTPNGSDHNLDQGSHVVRVAPVFGSGLGGPDYDAQEAVEARKYLAEGKGKSRRGPALQLS